jgi:hypothetical protein
MLPKVVMLPHKYCYPENGGDMTLKSIKEYVAAIRDRYFRGNKEEKGQILDEFVKVTGYHRKAAIRLLTTTAHSALGQRGRPAQYRSTLPYLKSIWEASDRLCSKRLQPFLPELITVLRRNNELHLDADTEARLLKMSAATMDRLLEPYRQSGGRTSSGTTRSGDLLKNTIPIRTFTDWQENKAGFLEIDLVAHCGENVAGFYLNTLSAVDVASGWLECAPVWGKSQIKVRQAVQRVSQRLPFPLLGLDSDNGSEFINQYFNRYCQQKQITFTRSRSYKKNDSCYVEQKNGNIVRRIVGYDRYSSKAAYACLERIYFLVRLYVNFFQPTMKLISKTRHGAKVHKVYEKAQTPYQRLLKLEVAHGAKQTELKATYEGLNPVKLLKQINGNLEQLWKMADRLTVR